MNESQKSSFSEDPQAFNQEFGHELSSLEQSLEELKQRYQDIAAAETEKIELQEAEKILQARQPKNLGLKTELKQLQTRLEELELILESRLLTWSSFKEPFWQIVRFGGLGVVLGWILHGCLRN